MLERLLRRAVGGNVVRVEARGMHSAAIVFLMVGITLLVTILPCLGLKGVGVSLMRKRLKREFSWGSYRYGQDHHK